jgi:plastocyanin
VRNTTNPVSRAILIAVLVLCVAICGCTSSGPSASPATTQTQVPGTMTVNIENFAFIPASITVPKGTTVTWVNQDTTDHQIVNDAQGSIGQGTLFTSNSLQKGAQFSFRFDTPGTYPYHCSIHPSMKATVIVT